MYSEQHIIPCYNSVAWLDGILFTFQHEKFTSQLQLSQKSSEAEGSKVTSAKAAEPKVQDTIAEVHHKSIDALKSEEKSAGKKYPSP